MTWYNDQEKLKPKQPQNYPIGEAVWWYYSNVEADKTVYKDCSSK